MQRHKQPFIYIERIRVRLNLHRVQFCKKIGYDYAAYLRWRRLDLVPIQPLVAARLLSRCEKPNKRNKRVKVKLRHTRWHFASLRVGGKVWHSFRDRTDRKRITNAAHMAGKRRGYKFKCYKVQKNILAVARIA